ILAGFLAFVLTKTIKSLILQAVVESHQMPAGNPFGYMGGHQNGCEATPFQSLLFFLWSSLVLFYPAIGLWLYALLAKYSNLLVKLFLNISYVLTMLITLFTTIMIFVDPMCIIICPFPPAIFFGITLCLRVWLFKRKKHTI